jgi:PPOX class probable F420-dependent enzyme
MLSLPRPIVAFLESGPLAHVVTLDELGQPHVSMAWVGLEDGKVVIGTLADQPKLRNLRLDPRIAMSFQANGRDAYGLDHYLVLRGTALVTEGGAARLLRRLAQIYLGAGVDFPPMPDPPPGFVIRMTVEKVSGNGRWSADD